MNSVLDQVLLDINELKELFKKFFSNHSKVIYKPDPYIEGLFYISSDYKWAELDEQGRRFQSLLYKKYNEFEDLCNVLISDLPKDSIYSFEENSKKILECIEQNGEVWEHSTEEVLHKISSSLDCQFSILESLYDLKSGLNIFVPDTNALLTSSSLEKWSFDGSDRFEILLVPTVLSELDKLKIYHSNRDVRDKAVSIIKRVKDLRNRGRLVDGVVLVKNKIYVRTIANEPNFAKTLSWLKIDNNDDKIIATFIEVMKSYPRSTIKLVTSDINLQNKAEFARIPFVEPPEITEV